MISELKRFSFIFLCLFVSQNLLFSQDIYFLEALGANTESNVLKVYDAGNCQVQTIFDFAQHGISDWINIKSLSFHPDGRLYMIAGDQIIAFNVLKRKIDHTYSVDLHDPLAYLAISENGRVLITDDPDRNDNDFLYLDYDLRNNRIIRTSTALEFFGIPNFSLGIGGFLPHDDLLFFGQTNTSIENYPESEPRFYGYWDHAAGQFDTIRFHHEDDYFLFGPSVYWPPCEPLQFLSTSSYNGLRNHDLIHLHISDRTIDPICPGQLYPRTTFPNAIWALNGVANVTDFRQSPLRIDLDGNNSSGHITAGYYDTLTTCRNEAPVVDSDVELYICGNPGSSGEVDSIAFRLIYYDQPRLPEERIYSDGYENELQSTASPFRWVWKNTGNRDPEYIKEFLLSLRYRADWDPANPDQSRERAVAVTLYVGSDSTYSWTVYQLEQDEIYAGRDTVVEYCNTSTSIDLSAYLSEESLPGGRFEPALSAGDGIFTPGTDPDDDYLYIVESGGCADTARITFQESANQDLVFEDITLCAEEAVRIGLPDASYQNVVWWNGDTGDSTFVTTSDDGPFWVEANQDGCVYRADFDVSRKQVVSFPEIITDTIQICPGDRLEIMVENLDSIVFLGTGYQSGDLVIISQPGQYTLEGFFDGCSVNQEIEVVQPMNQSGDYDQTIYWCEGTSLTITLPADSAGVTSTWSDGTTSAGRNVTSAGEYDLEVHVNGCMYQSTIRIIQNDEGECHQEECMVSIPNAVTPNGDGYNDFLEIFSTPSCGAIESVTLWNKWGGLLYSTNSPIIDSVVWQDLPVGIYIVQVEYRDGSGNRKIKSGSVFVIR